MSKKEKPKDNDSDSDSVTDDSDISTDTDEEDINKIISDLDRESDHEERLSKKKSLALRRKQKAKEILIEFAQMSTVHGVDHMGAAHTLRVIMFWSVMLLMCAAVFGYLFSLTLTRYLRYETVVTISMKNEQRFFPAVTVCNLNPYKVSELMKVPELAGLVKAFEYGSS